MLPSRLVSCSSSTRILIVRKRLSNESGYTQSSHSEQKMAPVVGSIAEDQVSFSLVGDHCRYATTYQTRIEWNPQNASANSRARAGCSR
jgi:hypothetical protein